MNENRRQKKVASLIKNVLSRLLFEVVQDPNSGIISITRLDMTKDLKTAHVYLSLFGTVQKEQVLKRLDEKKGYFRKVIASKTNLKYNPMLIFLEDPVIEYESKLDQIIDSLNKNEKSR
ncbi:MAG: 30S ribosome-binding factor RbfA [Candidatus Aminicenantes bacterium]|nr:30S ribosome-binding factor RbfA [Candidatus Aminicenantes bacterium]